MMSDALGFGDPERPLDPFQASDPGERQMQATELLLNTFPSADTSFRFAVAAAFDVVAEQEGILVSQLRGGREAQGRLQRIIRERYPRCYVRSRDPWTQASGDSRVIWYVFRGE
jgi:hypothetical protein